MKMHPVEAHTNGRTDKHNEANSHFFKFCERGQKLLFLNEMVIQLRSRINALMPTHSSCLSNLTTVEMLMKFISIEFY
jgi:hypothetical protein